MPCMQMRILEREREEEEDRKRKKKLEKEAKRKAEIAKAKAAIRDQSKKFGWRLDEVKPNVFVATKGYSNDKITFTVNAEGVIKTETDEISMANHSNAEQFLRRIAQVLRGTWKIFHRHPRGLPHSHAHGHHHHHA